MEAALSYIGCHSEGEFVCRDNDCWCKCSVDYPQCNCPSEDLKAMQDSLKLIRESWTQANQEFEESGKILPFSSFLVTFNETWRIVKINCSPKKKN